MGEIEGQEGRPEPQDAEADLRLGSSPRGTAANGVILALTRAARSFLLYDPSNEAIRHFLEALRVTMETYLRQYGDLPLVVRPFELVVDGEVVYLDRDRERSLAFRLFRDGVRRVTVGAGLEWKELLKLLEVLSIRYTGVRQTEDDMVVLLWKAGFQHIQIEAVEGFVPEEEIGDEEAPAAAQGGASVEAPPDFDLPAPDLRKLGPLSYRAVSPEDRAALVEEDGTGQISSLCVRLVDELLTAVGDPTDPMTFAEVVPQLREVRDFLLAEGMLGVVLGLVMQLNAAVVGEPDERERKALLDSFVDERALSRLLHSVPRDARQAPPEMTALLELVPGDHLRTLVAILGKEHVEAPRRVARSLVEGYVPARGDWIVQQVASAEAHLAAELLRALTYADRERAIEACQLIVGRPELDLQLEALHVLEKAELSQAVGRLLANYAAAPNEEVRVRAMELVGRRQVRTAVPTLIERIRRDAALRLGAREAEAAGEAMGRADPQRALEVFREWLKPRGIFSSVLPGTAMLQWTAVSGLVVVPGDEAEALIKVASEKGGSELQRHCTASMVKRRRLSRGATA